MTDFSVQDKNRVNRFVVGGGDASCPMRPTEAGFSFLTPIDPRPKGLVERGFFLRVKSTARRSGEESFLKLSLSLSKKVHLFFGQRPQRG